MQGYVLFALLTSLYLLPFMCVMLPRSNEGSILYGAERIVHGDVFARDFFEVMGPGSFYIVAVFFKVFGVNFLATRIWLFCSSLGIALCLYFLARRVCPRNALLPTLIVGGTWFGMQWPAVSHHLDSDLFSLLAVVLLVMWEERGSPKILYAVGICAGCVLWIHQSKGLLLFLVILAWCAIRALPGRSRLAAASRVAIGVAVVNMAPSAYFASQGALGALVDANLLWPMRNYTSINAVPYGLGIFSEYWRHWAVLPGTTSWWPVAFASVLIVPFVFTAALLLLLPVTVHFAKVRSMRSASIICLTAGSALWLSELHRMDIYHLAFGSPLLLIACIGLLGSSKLQVMRVALQVLAISAVCLLSTNFLQTVTTRRVATRVGPVGIFGTDAILRLVDANSSPGEEVFVYPDCPNYYFLTATTNPTRLSLLIYGYNPSTEFEEVVQTLERRRVRLVVWDSRFEERTAESVFPGRKRVAPAMQIVEPYLQSKYKQIGTADGFRVLLRNE